MLEKKEYVLSKQLLRSGTSNGANVEEALAGHSKRDFLSKMIISLKGTCETNYWLRLIKKSKLVEIDLTKILKESAEITHIHSAIVKTTKQTILNRRNFSFLILNF